MLAEKGWNFYDIWHEKHMPERECGFRYQLPALNRAIQSGHVDTLALLLETPSFNRD